MLGHIAVPSGQVHWHLRPLAAVDVPSATTPPGAPAPVQRGGLLTRRTGEAVQRHRLEGCIVGYGLPGGRGVLQPYCGMSQGWLTVKPLTNEAWERPLYDALA